VEVTNLKGYRTLNKKSMFRLPNFYTVISIHKKYHQYLIKKMEWKKNIRRAVVGIGILFFVAASAFVLKKHMHFQSIDL
jgi:hypothetical protein